MVEWLNNDFKVLESVKTKLGNSIQLVTNFSTFHPLNHSTLIIGVFHGDEPQGKYLIEKYLSLPPLPSPPPQGGREYKKQQYSLFAKIKSKELRKNMTDAEHVLWNFLRANRLYGLKFKRQQPIGNYVVDFVNLQHKLIIEINGGQHNKISNIEKDEVRTKFLESKGYKVLRFLNNEIFSNIGGCLESILNSLPPLRGKARERGLLFIPCLNPDGLQNKTRTNANGVDLNRNFPTKNWGEDTSTAGDNPQDYYGGKSAGSEIETQFVIDIVKKYQPKIIITLHAPYKIVNYDGPAGDIAQKISDIIDYPVEPTIGYPTPGSFGTYCGVERNIPTITLELDEKIPIDQLEQPVFEIFEMLKFGI